MADAIDLEAWDRFSDVASSGASSYDSTGRSETPSVAESVVSLETIWAKVDEIPQKRASLGLPVEKPGHPYPAENVACKFCKRCFRTTRQPITKRESPFLERARPGSLCCFSCRNGQNWAFKGWTAGKLEATINEDESFAFRYTIVIFT